MNFYRGDIYYFDLPVIKHTHIQNGKRPCIILSNNIGNKNSPTLVVVPMTTRKKRNMPTHTYLNIELENGDRLHGTTLGECILTVDKELVASSLLCHLQQDEINQIEDSIKVTLALA